MSANEMQATITDLTAAIQRMTAAVEQATAASDRRLAAIEARLARLESGPLAGAVARVGEVEGAAAVRERIDEVMVRLLDAETLESLARVAVLAPKLEYALQAVAAGPELLEEGLDVVRQHSDGVSPDARLKAVLGAAAAVTSPRTAASLGRVAARAADLEPTLDTAARSVAALEQVHGTEAMQARIGELLVTLGDPETMESLARIIALAPKLEYAAQAAAAGPELLEEALSMVKEGTEKRFGTNGALQARIETAADAAARLTEPATLQPLASMAAAAARLSPIVVAGADAAGRVTDAVGREAMEQRVSEVVLALADAETLESLTRIVALLPRVEYAVQALASGPELLEEALDGLRRWSADKLGGSAALDRRLGDALDALISLTQPALLRSLTTTLPDLLAAPGMTEALGSLTKLAKHAPQLGATVERATAAVGRAVEREGLGAADLDVRVEEATALLLDLSDPDKLAALRRAVKLVTLVDDALGELPEEDAERGAEQLARVIAALGSPDVLQGMRTTLDMLPRLSETIAALPVQPHTLELLRAANEAIEEASEASAPTGAWGLWRAISEPEVQATLGLGIDVVRRLGERLGARGGKKKKKAKALLKA